MFQLAIAIYEPKENTIVIFIAIALTVLFGLGELFLEGNISLLIVPVIYLAVRQYYDNKKLKNQLDDIKKLLEEKSTNE